MEDKDPPMEFDKVASSLIEQLGKAFQELNDHEDSGKDSVQWVDLEEYFKHLKTMILEKVEDLEIRKTQFGEKVSDARKLIAEREAVIIAKEQDLADRIQIIKDAAVLTIKEARERHQLQNIEVTQNDDNKESKFPLVPLLKAYLKDLRRNSQGNRHHSGRNGPKIDGNAKELAGLKVVIECIENYKLEDEYPLDPLLVRVAQLDKPKSDKRRFPESGRYPPRKRSRPNRNGLVSLPLVAGGRSAVSINTERPIYLNMPENMRYTHGGQAIYEYVAPPNQPLYQPPPNHPLYQPRNQPVYTQQVHAERAFNHVQDDQSANALYSPSYDRYDQSAKTIYIPSSPSYDQSTKAIYTPSSPSYDAIYGQQPPRKQYM